MCNIIIPLNLLKSYMRVKTILHQPEQAETDLGGASRNTCYGQTIVLAHSPYKTKLLLAVMLY